MRNTYLYGFATFGHPNDYRQTPFKFDNENIAKRVRIFDLSNAIKIFPNSKLYSIRKENIDGIPGISYAIYTYAQEMTSTREGTFIGSSILFTNEIVEENITIEKLNNFHSILVRINTENDILKVNHSSEFDHSKEFLSDFEKISQQLKSISELENINYTNRNIVVFSRIDPKTLTDQFKKSLLLLNKFDTIFFTDSREIIEYCKSKNILSIIDEIGLEQEVNFLLKEKHEKVIKSLSEFEIEKKKLEVDKENVITDIKNQLARNKNIHIENEGILRETESNIETISLFYKEFLKKLDDYVNQLKSGRKLEDVRKLYNENRNIFIDSISNLKQPQYITKLTKLKTNSNLKHQIIQQQILTNHSDIEAPANDKRPRRRRYKFYKITTAIFASLWICTVIYFLWINDKYTIENQVSNEPIAEPKTIVEFRDSIPLPELNPLPNSRLSQNDLNLIFKQGIKNKDINEVIEIIFRKNPTDIGKHYTDQKNIYEVLLKKENPNCFQNNICVCDSILNIPAYKK
jgi:hypothetical protein